MHCRTFKTPQKYSKYTNLISTDPFNRYGYQHLIQKYGPSIPNDKVNDRCHIGGAPEEEKDTIELFDKKMYDDMEVMAKMETIQKVLTSGVRWLNKKDSSIFHNDIDILTSQINNNINSMEQKIIKYKEDTLVSYNTLKTTNEKEIKSLTREFKKIKNEHIAEVNEIILRLQVLKDSLESGAKLNEPKFLAITNHIKTFTAKIKDLINIMTRDE